jgi:hypothetical protein
MTITWPVIVLGVPLHLALLAVILRPGLNEVLEAPLDAWLARTFGPRAPAVFGLVLFVVLAGWCAWIAVTDLGPLLAR